MLFYGTAWLIRGYLAFRSAYLPRLLGALMVVAGLGFVAKTVTQVLAPAYSSNLLLAPMFLNAVALAIWMLAKGVDRDKWDRADAAPD
jgi:predicted membrane chloride channel (bestrophin family)